MTSASALAPARNRRRVLDAGQHLDSYVAVHAAFEDGLELELCRAWRMQATNAAYDVRWIHTYVNRDKTKTFCIYEGPSEEAVRLANARNNLSINQLDEIPDDIEEYIEEIVVRVAHSAREAPARP